MSRDDITAPLRLWADRRFGEKSWISRLIWCYWCSGWWVAWSTSLYTLLMLMVLGVAQPHHLLALPILAPAVAYAASWIIDKEGD